MKDKTMIESFEDFFVVELAVREKKMDAYRLRYRVYCEDFEYEPHNNEQIEKDEYDDCSYHCLVIHKNSRKVAGCVRLVPALGNQIQYPLPFEKHCLNSLDQSFIDGLQLNRETVCEISRLAADRDFRKRAGESVNRFGSTDLTHEEMRTFPLVAVACFLAATAITDLTNRTNVFAMMEPFLPRMLKRSGIEFIRAGQDINYHGDRAPYFITTQSAIENMRPDLKRFYLWIRSQIEVAFEIESKDPSS